MACFASFEWPILKILLSPVDVLTLRAFLLNHDCKNFVHNCEDHSVLDEYL